MRRRFRHGAPSTAWSSPLCSISASACRASSSAACCSLRARVTGELERLLASIDLLLLPVMGVAAPSLAAMKARTPQTIASRLRYTAPIDMSGHPTLTLPGGMTADGVPVGFQIVGRSFDEAGILAAGHAFQQATDWHMRRPLP